MDRQPDVISFERRWRRRARRPGPGRIAIVLLALLLACLGVITYLALLVAQRDGSINDLSAVLRNARRPAPATAAGSAGPVLSGSAMFMLPDAAGGSFSVVALAIRPKPGSAALTWLFVYGRDAQPGARYGLLEDTCGGQYIAQYDVADGTADQKGDLTIVAPNLDISPQAPDVWVLLYRWEDGAPLGGIKGPLASSAAKTFRSVAPC